MVEKAIDIKISKKDQKYLDQFVKKFGLKDGTNKLLKSLIPLFDKLGLKIASDISRNELSGQLLNARTSALRRSIHGQAELVAQLPAIVVGVFKGPALVYAGIQNDGGIIKPKKAKTLAMPIGTGALTPSGVSKYVSPRDYPTELTYIGINRGNVVAALMDEDLNLQYLLLKQVTIKATHYLEAGVNKNIGFVTDQIANFLEKEILK